MPTAQRKSHQNWSDINCPVHIKRKMKNNTPSDLSSDEVDDGGFDEQEVIEVIEADSLEDLSGSNDEDESLPGDGEEPERDDAKFVFKKHTNGVLCCAFHPKLSNIVATGGMDDVAYVWDITSGDVLLQTKAHEDSVEMVGFSHDGKYLATSDLKGRIQVWNTNGYSLAREFELDDEFSWSQWHHGSNVLISSSQNGMIYMYKILTGEQKMVMTPFGTKSMCGKVFPDGKRLACGYSDGNLRIIDLKQGTTINTVKISDENGGVSCVDVHKDNNVLICGCENGDVVLVSSQAGKVLGILNSSRVSNMKSYVETISFCKDPTYNFAASGSLDGNLVVWDVGRQIQRHRTSFSSSVNQLIWHNSQPVLYTSHANGTVNVFDSKSGIVLREFMGHSKCIYSIDLSPDGDSLLTTSEDKTARIYRIEDDKKS